MNFHLNVIHFPEARATAMMSALDGVLAYLLLDKNLSFEDIISKYKEVFVNETLIIDNLNNQVDRQKTMKILLNIDLAGEGSPARTVDSMWEAGNKKTPLQNGISNYQYRRFNRTTR